MEISEVRVKLIHNPSDRLKAFCSVTFDSDFVIRDIKIIEGSGGLFVAMPSRKLSDHCPKCHSKNHLRAQYCNECGAALGAERVRCDDAGRRKLHADIAHPINSECRQRLQERVVEAFQQELDASKNPDYRPDDYDNEYDEEAEEVDDVEEVEDAEDIEEVEYVEEPDGIDESDDDDAADPDEYGQMILELKRDAADRRTHGDRTPRDTPYAQPAPPDVDEDFAEDTDDAAVETQRAEDFNPRGRPRGLKSSGCCVAPSSTGWKPVPDGSGDDDAFGAGLTNTDDSAQPAKNPIEPKRTVEPATTEDDLADDFGAGLL